LLTTGWRLACRRRRRLLRENQSRHGHYREHRGSKDALSAIHINSPCRQILTAFAIRGSLFAVDPGSGIRDPESGIRDPDDRSPQLGLCGSRLLELETGN
jgi:hypothetical protein